MLKRKPSALPANTELIFKIVDATSEYQDCGAYARNRFVFKMKVWEKSDLNSCYIVEEVLYNHGFCADYLVDFVTNATGQEFIWFWTDVDFCIGAVFLGMIVPKVKVNYYNHKTLFQNTIALQHLGYLEEKGGEKR